jgi:hypothetical protein
MDALRESRALYSRRNILKSSAIAALPLAIPAAKHALADQDWLRLDVRKPLYGKTNPEYN